MRPLVLSTLLFFMFASQATADQAAPDPGTATAGAAAPAEITQAVQSAPKEATPAPEPAKPEGTGIGFPGGVRLNGKFDAAYERTGYSGNLKKGVNALRNFHHFIFVSRESKDDPFFLSAEVIDKNFYEFGARLHTFNTPLYWTVRTGKLVVPFGGEPLFHHEYGGLSGFDQRILPVIWSQIGAAAQVRYRGEGWSIGNDVFGIQGYELKSTDTAINLQSDFSTSDKVRFGVGNRISAGWGPLHAWYSAYYNTLGFERRLFMQALDVTLWRPAGIPVLRDMSFGMGAVRADVSGGGPGTGYYHFGDYAEVRYYPLDWLYVEGRTGVGTVENQHGLFQDSKKSPKNTTAYNVGIVYKRDGFTVGLHHYWNLEQVNEKPNDFLRIRTMYEF